MEPRSLPEIIDQIVDELGNPGARPEVAQAIERSFDFFRRYGPLFARAAKAALAANAKGITDSIAAFEAKLAAASPLLDDFLFTPPWARGKVISADVLLAMKTACRDAVLEPLRQMRQDLKESRLMKRGKGDLVRDRSGAKALRDTGIRSNGRSFQEANYWLR